MKEKTKIRQAKNYMSISRDAECPFDEIQHLFMIKILGKVGIERTCLNIIKTMNDKKKKKSQSMYSMVKS